MVAGEGLEPSTSGL